MQHCPNTALNVFTVLVCCRVYRNHTHRQWLSMFILPLVLHWAVAGWLVMLSGCNTWRLCVRTLIWVSLLSGNSCPWVIIVVCTCICSKMVIFLVCFSVIKYCLSVLESCLKENKWVLYMYSQWLYIEHRVIISRWLSVVDQLEQQFFQIWLIGHVLYSNWWTL